MATLTFHGAARQVTGSMHLLEVGGRRVMLDCGMFQGRRSEARELNRHHPCEPQSVEAVVLSHAHLDHIGRLPLLVQGGFRRVIHATPATRDLCAIMLADSANIQEEDAHWLNRHRPNASDPLIEPLYTTADAVAAVKLIASSPYDRWFDVVAGVRARYFEAGHMLGSAGVELELKENGKTSTLVFSGDVGRAGTPILRDPVMPPPCDWLICESTYGNRETEAVEGLAEQLAQVVQRTVARRGRIIVPAFAVGRSQTVVYHLNQLIAAHRVPRIPVYIDSPLAIDATEVFKLHPDCYDVDARQLGSRDAGILGGRDVHYVRSVEDSKRVMRRRNPCVIIAGSGMCEAGRVVHHLKHSVSNERNTILIVGYQAQHTLGRRLVERQPVVRVLGEKRQLAAEVVVLNGFSSHADASELGRYIDCVKGRCRGIFLVHGEPDQSMPLAERLRAGGHVNVQVPDMCDVVSLD